MICPHCGHTGMAYDSTINMMRCPACEHQQPKPAIKRLSIQKSTPSAGPVEIKLPLTFRYHRFSVDNPYQAASLPTLRSYCERALDAISRGDRAVAREHLKYTLDFTENFADVWLFLAGLAETAEEQRECLNNLLALEPHNADAIRAKAELDGLLKEPTSHPRDSRLETGETTARKINCPSCGGMLTYDVGQTEVRCQHCNHLILDVEALHDSGEWTHFVVGLLQRKKNPVDWNIGQRWLRCESCGATTTLSSHTLTNTCHFCHSQQVIEENVNDRFDQPDLILPFTVDEHAARQRIEGMWTAPPKGLKGILGASRPPISRLDIEGIYLPFWVFDADMTVYWSWTGMDKKGEQLVPLTDVLFFAARIPPRVFMDTIEPFDLDQAVDYDPRLLADYPAELYDIDFDRASIEVRDKLQKLVRKHAEPRIEVSTRPIITFDNDEPGKLVLRAETTGMSYRLALLPVWMVRLTDGEGGTSQGVINGQTSEAALSKPRR